MTDNEFFNAMWERSLRDLRMLSIEEERGTFIAAGTPWFSALFGRDSIISALQTLAYQPRLARDTLRLLAARQGIRVDEWRDEEPGKILHEVRDGEMASLNEIPMTPYYGSVDATPLVLRQRISKPSPGVSMSRIGRCHQRIPSASTSSGSDVTPSSSNA